MPENKFSGEDIGENWYSICLQYETDAALYSLTDYQKLEYTEVILRDDALQYYVEHVRGKAETYEMFKALIHDHFTNRSIQERIKTYLQGLRLEKFTKNGDSPNDTLIKLVSN